ncbi:maleylpyruvate isomerase N-terminal domain-containing protein [Nocardia sp. alder85J]|uniref:maleylpyruvate isomerase N-terminal domain-containing protein n=1 Tax=Nocardia sp. alder85J TaxID=2862949 RepID=UPI001CD6C014|nr:maleylpyruvate isomerase N-terminal domain-containing protein [Nocardia sp. alder85J]MCX4098469.1 maleylpyruvate isomerase N-terminal domain-containing protein [Nocardia sp. alder85J]
MVHAERAAPADDLAGLDEAQWQQRTLCGQWTVEEVVAHLTAAARLTGRARDRARSPSHRRVCRRVGRLPARGVSPRAATLPEAPTERIPRPCHPGATGKGGPDAC